jgi:HEAT repeat protein
VSLRSTTRSALVSAVIVVGPLLLWQWAFDRAVRRDVEILALPYDAPAAPVRRAEADARLASLGPEALPQVLQSFAFNEAPLRKGVTVARSGLSTQAGPLVVPAMNWLRDHADLDVIGALVAALSSDNHDIRHFAGLTLAFIGRPAVPPLVQALRGADDASVRAAAAFSLSFMGAEGAEAIEPLRAALQDGDKDVRLVARYALQQLGPGNDGFWAAVDAARKSRVR